MYRQVETPAIIVDMAKLHKNLKAMSDCIKASGCSLRPHVKTHKIPGLAHLQLEYGAKGITCAKVSEAELMAAAGIKDIFIAYPLAGDFRVRRAVELARHVRLILAVDSMETAAPLSRAASDSGLELEVRLEVDTGLRRTGVPFDRAIELAHQVSELPGIHLNGIFTFRGLMLGGKPTTDNLEAGHEEGKMLVKLAEQMRTEGLDIRDVSGGSSPTGRYVAEVEGVTEVRPGTYIFQDYMQVWENACRAEDCAAFVLATVVSAHSEDYAVIDGGSKTFGTDFAINAPPFYYPGYGCVRDNPDLILTRVNEEHGIITGLTGRTGLRVGQQVQIIPTHICSTVNLHNNIWLQEDGKLRKVRVEARGMLV